MRISDWSSDVCSSDLGVGQADHAQGGLVAGLHRGLHVVGEALLEGHRNLRGANVGRAAGLKPLLQDKQASGVTLQRQRSEEHTSELQSLMRISYAVFCLNKKN